ncbi:hypothetical protein HQN90_17725 [Paenibacillus alba]|uniref:hypothetical protein n=1 Tax=Paenibacillus alba TaxID=1197127 RepID=UPI001C201D25|nr:hypothetical protein [Paenibacillus alba]NQX67964.1 hypothetical protein [Paenibacillus alba]
MTLKNEINAARHGAKLLDQDGYQAESYAIESLISEAEILSRRSSTVSTLKKGDHVVIHTCLEASNPKYAGKLWACKSDAFRAKGHDYCSIFLEGFSGSFSAEYLQKVDSKELTRLQGVEHALQDFGLPNGTAQDVFDWLESTTGYRSEQV